METERTTMSKDRTVYLLPTLKEYWSISMGTDILPFLTARHSQKETGPLDKRRTDRREGGATDERTWLTFDLFAASCVCVTEREWENENETVFVEW